MFYVFASFILDLPRSVIEFRVSKSWIEENNIDISTIVLKRSHDRSWTSFATEITGEDEGYLFFEAEARTSPGMHLWKQK
ncbi:cell surface protein [Methanosarcina horonobensis HB-1 = JCM 15518]|uniref:Cell surface protein n=1 Tax=Methanosarcina horonobensis HB-1 = JCM 15518 TaxID=1434110 RepID=A0A0E3SF47_9EURY|nr:PGF-pre-PGF domain-containing protein [Methanosarcina horonobensis]AKB78867.1 cell surface protein [Methanosarcina horonobensis HB-1 = JCM 15518]